MEKELFNTKQLIQAIERALHALGAPALEAIANEVLSGQTTYIGNDEFETTNHAF